LWGESNTQFYSMTGCIIFGFHGIAAINEHKAQTIVNPRSRDSVQFNPGFFVNRVSQKNDKTVCYILENLIYIFIYMQY